MTERLDEFLIISYTLSTKDSHIYWKERDKKITLVTCNQKRTEATILRSDKIDFKLKTIRQWRVLYNDKVSIHQLD